MGFRDFFVQKPSDPRLFLQSPSIDERRRRIAKTLAIADDVLSRTADALIEELDFRLVTDAPKMLAVIREAERLGPDAASGKALFAPYPQLLFFAYEPGNPSVHLLTDRLGGRWITKLIRRLHRAISVEAMPDPKPIEIEGRAVPLPDFASLPAFEFDEHALVATIEEGRFFWLSTYHPGDTTKTWFVKARESLRRFPQLKDVFQK